MNGFERRREKKKALVLSAALELFQNHGFAKVSINEIAYKAEVSPATIYNHFGSKYDLIRECINKLLQDLTQKYKTIMLSDQPFDQRLATIVMDKADIASQFQGELMQTILRVNPDYLELFWQKQFREITDAFISEGKTRGDIDPQIPNDVIHLYFEIFTKGMSYSSLRKIDLVNQPQMATYLMRLLVNGIKSR